MTSWSEFKVSELAYVNKSVVDKNYQHDEILYLDVASTDQGKVTAFQPLKLKEAPSRAKRILKDNDFVISTVRPNLKHYAFIKKIAPNTVASTGYAVITAKREVCDPRFLYYLLTNQEYTDYLTRIADGHTSTYPSFNPDVIENTLVKIPSLVEQKKISDFLGNLDDKIELNNQINETLESMAKTIFKEWFIDFGPVKAKAEGKKPFGMDDETASIFPDSFEDSELGLIPKGWRIKYYKDLMSQSKDNVVPDKFQFETCFHYSLPNYDNGKTPFEEKIGEIKSNKFRVNADSILFSKLNPKTPRVWLPLHEPKQDIKCLGSTEFVVIKPTDRENRWIAYCLLTEGSFLERMAQIATGTSNSHQRIKPESIFEQKCVFPPQKVFKKFNTLVTPIFELYLNNQKEDQSLKKLRDLLLPKLISGEVSV